MMKKINRIQDDIKVLSERVDRHNNLVERVAILEVELERSVR
jgi:hypothetical protein